MKNKAFTLVELIATIAILGIILGISVPNVLKLMQNNDEKTMEYFGKTLINSAKAYVNDNKMESNDPITCDDLKKAGYIKECKIKNYDCGDEKDLKVIVTKEQNNTYTYKYRLRCARKNKNGSTPKLYEG